MNEPKPPALDVLFVEDNEDHAELVMRSLREHHIANHIHHLTDGEAALDFLYQRGPYAGAAARPRPQLVLLDLRLPKVDGLQVLAAIKADETLRRIPVVILTTSETESDVARAQDCNANAYVVKPLDFSQFVGLMRDLGFFWLLWNMPPAEAE